MQVQHRLRQVCLLDPAALLRQAEWISLHPRLLDLGLSCMIGKGERSQEVVEAIVRNGAVYLLRYWWCRRFGCTMCEISGAELDMMI